MQLESHTRSVVVMTRDQMSNSDSVEEGPLSRLGRHLPQYIRTVICVI